MDAYLVIIYISAWFLCGVFAIVLAQLTLPYEVGLQFKVFMKNFYLGMVTGLVFGVTFLLFGPSELNKFYSFLAAFTFSYVGALVSCAFELYYELNKGGER